MDPRLWSAIVAPHTYLLPTFTYDLSPWVGVLNTASGSAAHTITVEVFGATNAGWSVAATLLLWRSNGHTVAGPAPHLELSPSMMQPVKSQCHGRIITDAGVCQVGLSKRSMTAYAMIQVDGLKLIAFSKYSMSDYANNIEYNNTAGTESWRQTTYGEATWFMGRLDSHTKLELQQEVQEALQSPGLSLEVTDSVLTAIYTSRKKSKGVVTQSCISYGWLNAGGIAAMAPFEFSQNATVAAPFVYANLDAVVNNRKHTGATTVVPGGSQKHYQRLLMLDVYDPSNPTCNVPPYATHYVNLRTSLVNGVPTRDCMWWEASCAFCAPGTVSDFVKVQRQHPCE